tara:strand:+ start:282 stop:497 length:216 start_codon:yes stop_codon:yes gene_type:complete
MKYDVYINTSVSVYDVEAKTEKEAQTKALKLMLKQIRQKDPSIDTEQVQHLRINYVMDSDDWYPTHGGNNE